MCKYMEYRQYNGQDYIFCLKSNDMCNYAKYCNAQRKYIPNERWERCKLMNTTTIPNGSNRVLFERKGYLYVDFGDRTEKIKNTLNEQSPQYVYVRTNESGYEISLTPFVSISNTKKTRKKKEIED